MLHENHFYRKQILSKNERSQAYTAFLLSNSPSFKLGISNLLRDCKMRFPFSNMEDMDKIWLHGFTREGKLMKFAVLTAANAMLAAIERMHPASNLPIGFLKKR